MWVLAVVASVPRTQMTCVNANGSGGGSGWGGSVLWGPEGHVQALSVANGAG